MIKAVQQFALRAALVNDRNAREALMAAKAAGYEGIELCSYLLYKLPLSIRFFTKMAGMGIGACGKLD